MNGKGGRKNMRLIDAEALKESVRKKFEALHDRCEINGLVNAAPAIDAIPVEWLKEQTKNNDGYCGTLIRGLLSEWWKEQGVIP